MFLFSNIACVSKGKTVTISHTLRKRNSFLIENKQIIQRQRKFWGVNFQNLGKFSKIGEVFGKIFLVKKNFEN